VAQSKGENLLLNLSFVSALIEFAQMRSGTSGDFLVSGQLFPVSDNLMIYRTKNSDLLCKIQVIFLKIN